MTMVSQTLIQFPTLPTFNEDVTGFDVTDITVTGTAFGGSSSAASNFGITGDDTYTFDVQTSSDGTVTVSIPAYVATDTRGNPSLASVPSTATVDTVAPTVVITGTAVVDGGFTTSKTVSYNVVFDETVTGFDNAETDIELSGTAAATASALTGTGTEYTFVVTVSGEGTVIASIPPGAATGVDGNGNTASDTYTVAVSDISPIDSVDLLDNGYRHNLVHLTGNYYVSSHTVTTPDTPTHLDSAVTLRLYRIIDGFITPIGSQVIQDNAQERFAPPHEFETEPKSTGLTRVDDDTIAISYVVGGTSSSTVATYDVDTDLEPYFNGTHSVNFRDGTNGDQTHNHTLIAFDENRLVIAYSYLDSDPTGFIQVINIDPNDGVLDADPAVPTTTNNPGLHNSLVKLNDDRLVLAYRGATAQGFLRVFDISADGIIDTDRSPLKYETRRTAYHSITMVDDNTVAVAYSTIGLARFTSDGEGIIKIFDVTSKGDVTEMSDSVYYDAVANTAFEEQAHLNSLALLDSDTLAVAYRGAGADGFIPII